MLLLKRNYFLVHKKEKYKCSVGKNGIRRYKMEGDLCTPTGVFELGPIYFRKDRIPKLNTKMKKFSIEKNMYWEDDPKKKNYNKLSFNKKKMSESLYRKDNIYDIVLVINYNNNPIIPKRGSALFMHITKENYLPTKGCIALKKTDMIKIIGKLTPTEKILISF